MHLLHVPSLLDRLLHLSRGTVGGLPTPKTMATHRRNMPADDRAPPLRKIDDTTDDTPPEKPVRRQLLRIKRWFILDVERNVVAGCLLGGSFVVIVFVGSFGPVSVQSFLTEGISPATALVELMKAIVSVVVIVLSINQLVLSPGLGPVGEQRERFEQSIDLRQKVEAHTGSQVSPVSPASFLVVILDEIIDQAERIDEVVSRTGEQAVRPEIVEFTDAVIADATLVRRRLASGRFGTFEVISAALRFSMSEKFRSLRVIQQGVDESSPESLSTAIDGMNDLFELFTITREYLKTIYIREEYIRLSEGLLYTGLPAILVTYCAAQIYAPTVFPGQVFGIETQLLFVSGAVTAAFVPLAILLSYVFRLAALSRSTLFVGPFDVRTTGKEQNCDHVRVQ